jgi:hypothetical protein
MSPLPTTDIAPWTADKIQAGNCFETVVSHMDSLNRILPVKFLYFTTTFCRFLLLPSFMVWMPHPQTLMKLRHSWHQLVQLGMLARLRGLQPRTGCVKQHCSSDFTITNSNTRTRSWLQLRFVLVRYERGSEWEGYLSLLLPRLYSLLPHPCLLLPLLKRAVTH